MDERLQFVARRLAGEPMAELCREFGISRKTGYKIFDRYQECGMQGLTDRSRRPYRYANQLPFQVENYILNMKQEHPSWGARKIRDRLLRRFSGIPIPAKSTVHAVLDRHGLKQSVRGSERHTVIAADVGGQAALFKKPLKYGESVVFPGRRKRLTREEKAAGVVGDGERVAVLVIS